MTTAKQLDAEIADVIYAPGKHCALSGSLCPNCLRYRHEHNLGSKTAAELGLSAAQYQEQIAIAAEIARELDAEAAAPSKKSAKPKKVAADIEAAVKATQLYIGKGLRMRITDEQKLYRRMNSKIAAVAKKRGMAETEAYRQIMGEAKRRGGVSPMPGKDI